MVGRGVISGRIKNYQRNGITPISPGTGKRIAYTFDDVARWALCFELAQFGLGASHILPMMSAAWPDAALAMHGHPDAEDSILYFEPSFVFDEGSPHLFICPETKFWERPLKNNGQRFAQINLSMLRRRIERALVDVVIP